MLPCGHILVGLLEVCIIIIIVTHWLLVNYSQYPLGVLSAKHYVPSTYVSMTCRYYNLHLPIGYLYIFTFISFISHVDVTRCYCVIIFVGQFWPPDIYLISVQSLIYTPISFFSSCIVPVMYMVGSPQNVYGPQPMTARLRCEDQEGEWGHIGDRKIT